MTPAPQRILLSTLAAEALRREIASGAIQQELPGELELCHRLKVSRVTVRAALAILQEAGEVSSGKGRRRKVLKPPRISRSSAASAPVVILSPTPLEKLTAFKLLWIDSLRSHLAARGMEMHFLARAAVQRSRPGSALQQIVRDHAGAVWILLRASPDTQRWFAAQRLPAVVAGSRVPGVALPSVDVDYHASCRHAAGQLQARGCRRLVLVCPQEMLAGDVESRAGFMEGAGRTPVSILTHDATPDGLARSLDALLAQPHAALGMLVLHSTHAVTTLCHLMRRGRAVPEDCRLISRDHDSILDCVVPRLAHYALSPESYARRLAKSVAALTAGVPLPAQAQLLIPKFNSGETLG
jgi:LacI family transcriptional regulator